MPRYARKKSLGMLYLSPCPAPDDLELERNKVLRHGITPKKKSCK